MKDIREASFEELENFVVGCGEKKFRAKQIWDWLWKRGVASFQDMTNISAGFRETLAGNFTFHAAKVADEVVSGDKSVKFVIELHDGKAVEGVLIPQGDRVTACVSTQVGCPLNCAFCATGTMGFVRNLHYSEIVDEYLLLDRRAESIYGRKITNIVYMGMGEPLINVENTVKSVEMLTSQESFGLSPSRITISTAGVTNGIRTLADKDLRCGLAISLHSANPVVRREIMPVSRRNSLADLREALVYYHKKTGDRITVEYLLLSGVNDTEEDAEQLARFCRAFPVKINIIEYNPTENSSFIKSSVQDRERFINVLKRCNMVVNVRFSKGRDISAACGQLVKKRKD